MLVRLCGVSCINCIYEALLPHLLCCSRKITSLPSRMDVNVINTLISTHSHHGINMLIYDCPALQWLMTEDWTVPAVTWPPLSIILADCIFKIPFPLLVLLYFILIIFHLLILFLLHSVKSLCPYTKYNWLIDRLMDWLKRGVMATESWSKRAITLSCVNCSGYEGDVTIFSRIFKLLFSSRITVMVWFSAWLVSGYAHVFVLLSVVIVPHPTDWKPSLVLFRNSRYWYRRTRQCQTAGYSKGYHYRKSSALSRWRHKAHGPYAVHCHFCGSALMNNSLPCSTHKRPIRLFFPWRQEVNVGHLWSFYCLKTALLI